MKKSFIICLSVLLLLPALLGSGCDEKTEGELPVLKTGDEWVSTVILNGSEYTQTQEITGEENLDEKDCYVTKADYDPPLDGSVYSVIVYYEKSTLQPVKKQYSYTEDGVQMIVNISYTYELTAGVQPYPMEVGMEYTLTETVSSYKTSTENGPVYYPDDINTYVYKVEKTEYITVPAGRFKCFKIVRYDETGTTILKTTWKSDKTRHYIVKETDQDGEITRELQSCSLK